MNKRSALLFVLCNFVLFAFCAQAFGETYESFVGKDRSFSGAKDGDSLETLVNPNRSYCCEVISGDEGDFTLSTFSISGATGVITAARGNVAPVLSFVGGDTGESRVCFYYTGGPVIGRAIMDVSKSSGGTSTIETSCRETTLVSGFNTSVTDFNFVEITNTLVGSAFDSGVVSGIVIAVDSISDSTVLSTPFSLAPGDRLDVDIHTAAGASKFGPIYIIHNGPRNALHAVNSQYNITNLSPLDFEPVVQQPFRTRDFN